MTQLSREELRRMTDRYLDALAGHAANRLPLAGHVRYTENGQQLALNDGLWGTTTKHGNYRIDIIDTTAQQVGYIGVLYQQDKACCFSARLRLEDGYVTEIEALINHPALMGGPGGGGMSGAAELDKKQPHPVFGEKILASQREPRARLIEIANTYFSGLENSDGSYPTPFTDDCNRLENGMQTTNIKSNQPTSSAYQTNIVAMTPDEQFKSGFFRIVTSIRNRRFPVVDEENGNVLAFGFFDHNGTVDKYKLSNGQDVTSGLRNPFTWQIAELFKVTNSKLRQIEAVLTGVPYGMRCDCWDK